MATRTDGGQRGTGPRGATTIRNPGDEGAPGTPQTGEASCPECGGTGRAQGGDCPNCGGTGRVVQIVGDA
jgi:DnaJ-class molecular chaperone